MFKGTTDNVLGRKTKKPNKEVVLTNFKFISKKQTGKTLKSLQGSTTFDVDYSGVVQVIIMIASEDPFEGVTVSALHVWKCAETTVGTSPAGTTTEGTLAIYCFHSYFKNLPKV